MTLCAFHFTQGDFAIQNLSPLNLANLLVSKNAVGKSRLLQTLQFVARFIKEGDLPTTTPFSFSVSFLPDETHTCPLSYTVSTTFNSDQGRITEERLAWGNENVLYRNIGRIFIDKEVLHPTVNRLAVVEVRDEDKYLEIEQLLEWAADVCLLPFPAVTPASFTPAPSGDTLPIAFTKMLEGLGDGARLHVCQRLQALGYPVTKIVAKTTAQDTAYYLKEDLRYCPCLSLSKGLLRVLYLLVFMEYSKQMHLPSLLLIDDFGEGVDCTRLTPLIQVLLEYSAETHVQVLFSSSDALVMSAIDLDLWQILVKGLEGDTLMTLNKTVHPALFSDFCEKGLPHPELFTNGYIEHYLAAYHKQLEEARAAEMANAAEEARKAEEAEEERLLSLKSKRGRKPKKQDDIVPDMVEEDDF